MKYSNLATILVTLVIGISLFTGCKSRSAEEQKKLDIKLCQASVNGDLKQIKDLLPKGADPNTTQCGEYAKVGYPTPIFFALIGVEREINDLFRQEGTSQYHSDDKQRLTVMALLAAGANPNIKSNTIFQETPLMYAELVRASGIAQALKDGGADPNLTDANGRQAKDYATMNIEEVKSRTSGHLVVRLAIAFADKEAAEKELINDVVPKR